MTNDSATLRDQATIFASPWARLVLVLVIAVSVYLIYESFVNGYNRGTAYKREQRHSK